MRSKEKYNWLLIFLLVFFLSEVLFNLFIWNHREEWRIAGVVKFISQIFMGVLILQNWSRARKEGTVLILLMIFFIVGQLFIRDNDNWWRNLEYLNNALFIPIVLLFFSTATLSRSQKERGIQVYEMIVKINSVLILLGVAFGLRWFQTYLGPRFGYDGLLFKSSYASYFHLIALVFFAVKWDRERTKKNLFWLVVVIAASCFTGTKAAWLSVGLIGLFLALKIKSVLKYYVLGFMGLTAVSVVIFKDQIVELLIRHSKTYGPIITDDGLITALFSFRNQILTEQLIPYILDHWTVVNYIIGGMGNILDKSGFDLIDLVYFFGFLGAPIYLWLLYKLFFIKRKIFDFYYLVGMLLLVSSLGGNLFYNSSIAIFLVVIKSYFEITYESKD